MNILTKVLLNLAKEKTRILQTTQITFYNTTDNSTNKQMKEDDSGETRRDME